MRSLLSLFTAPPRRHAASDRCGGLIEAHFAAYAREQATLPVSGTRSCAQNRKLPVPLSRGTLAWACVDLQQMEVG